MLYLSYARWYTEDPSQSCAATGTIKPGGGKKTGSAHASDWNTADSTTSWIKQVVKSDPETPFFVYQGVVADWNR